MHSASSAAGISIDVADARATNAGDGYVVDGVASSRTTTAIPCSVREFPYGFIGYGIIGYGFIDYGFIDCVFVVRPCPAGSPRRSSALLEVPGARTTFLLERPSRSKEKCSRCAEMTGRAEAISLRRTRRHLPWDNTRRHCDACANGGSGARATPKTSCTPMRRVFLVKQLARSVFTSRGSPLGVSMKVFTASVGCNGALTHNSPTGPWRDAHSTR
jgi:hypothetical protein